jgi:sigma-70-like protein
VIWRADLQALSDRDLLAQMRALPSHSEERAAICEILVERYTSLVQSCVWPYRRSPEPVEDLMQVGYVGLLKAINNFNPKSGTAWPPTPRRASAARSNGTSVTSGGWFTSAVPCRNCCLRCAR